MDELMKEVVTNTTLITLAIMGVYPVIYILNIIINKVAMTIYRDSNKISKGWHRRTIG